MAFMSRDEFLRVAEESPWAARDAFTQAYYNARGDVAERQRIFACGIDAAPAMLTANKGAGDTFIGDLICLSQDASEKAEQLDSLFLKEAAGNQPRYWAIKRRQLLDQMEEPKAAPVFARHAPRPPGHRRLSSVGLASRRKTGKLAAPSP